MSNKIQVYVDADPIVYRDGYVSEVHNYGVIAENTVDGSMHQLHFENGAAKQAYFKDNAGMEVVDSERLVTPAPVAHALHTVKHSVASIKSAIEKEYEREAVLNLYLSGPENFRIDLATIRPYKGNRSPEKPFHYQTIRDYLTTRWEAEVVTGREADDEISIQARRDGQGVIATIDKDLDQIPGKHYNYKDKVHYAMGDWECTRFFYIQALSGDSGDNIAGCFRTGPGGAETLIDQWVEYWYEHADGAAGMHELEVFLWAKIVGMYQASLGRETAKLKCDYKDAVESGKRTIEDIALENARLVFMQEYALQLWNPPGITDDLLQENFNG